MATARSFSWQPIAVIGIVIALTIALLILWFASYIFLVIFAAILFAILVDGLAMLMIQWISLPRGLARGVVIVLLLVAVAAFLTLAGPRVSSQLSQLADQLPRSIEQLSELIKAQPWGSLLDQLNLTEHLKPSATEILADISGVFSTAFTVIANIFVIFFIGMYLALQPDLYVRGLMHLIPKNRRERGEAVLIALGHALRWWLVGRFAAMAAVGILTTLSLALIHTPLALVLGVIAGLFSFVPYIGPIASVVPAVLIGLTKSPLMALYVLIIYSLVLFTEGNFLTPLIQKRAVSLPPAILLSMQFAMGIFYGVIGLLLATPLAVALIVLIQMLYVQDLLKDTVEVLGEHKRSRE